MRVEKRERRRSASGEEREEKECEWRRGASREGVRVEKECE